MRHDALGDDLMTILLEAAVALSLLTPAELEVSGRAHLYNLEYEAARGVFSSLSEAVPKNPAGPYYEATALWMETFTKRGGMAGSTFRTGRYWARTQHEPVPEALGREFHGLVSESIARADAILAKRPDDRDALYFRGAAEGVRSAWEASLEHAYFRAYRSARRGKGFHDRLLEIDPDDADAHLLPGLFEYTVATLPRTLRFAGFLFGVRGNKDKGIAFVDRAASSGRRTAWVARLSSSVMYQREKKYRRALELLRALEAAFPKNPLLPLERGSVHLQRKDFRAARRVFQEVERRQRAGEPNFERVEPSLVKLRVAESLLFAKRFESASEALDTALGKPGVPDHVKAVIFLRRGMASDGLGRRDAALWDYRRAIAIDADKITNRLAKRYSRKPFR